MKEFSKVNVLGTQYTIYKDTTELDRPFISGADGITDFTTKEIFIAPLMMVILITCRLWSIMKREP